MRNNAQTIRHTVAKYGIPLVIILRWLSLLLQLDKHMTCGIFQENLQPHEIGWKSLILKNSILISVFAAKATSNHRFKSIFFIFFISGTKRMFVRVWRFGVATNATFVVTRWNGRGYSHRRFLFFFNVMCQWLHSIGLVPHWLMGKEQWSYLCRW